MLVMAETGQLNPDSITQEDEQPSILSIQDRISTYVTTIVVASQIIADALVAGIANIRI
jgi:hypothetical protein